MDYGDDYWGLHRNYYRDPFPHALLCVEGEFQKGFSRLSNFKPEAPNPLLPSISKSLVWIKLQV